MMFLRYLSVVIGLAILAAVAHVTVEASGGYADPHAVLVIAVAAGVGVGALAIGAAWSERRWVLGVVLLVALLCGEAFGLLQTGERLIASREAAQGPVREALAAKASAQRAVDAARAALAALSSSQRLDTAMQAKSAADKAVLVKSALRGCASNCRKLLEAQIATAAVEVTAARAELQAKRDRARRRLQVALTALAAIKLPTSTTGLASRLKLPTWGLDLLVAALGAIGANGLGASLLAFGAHRPRRGIRAIDLPVMNFDTVEPDRPALRPVRNARQHMAKFASERITVSAGARTGVTSIHADYKNWCAASGISPLHPKKFGKILADLFEHTGTAVDHDDGQFAAIDIAIKPNSRDLVSVN